MHRGGAAPVEPLLVSRPALAGSGRILLGHEAVPYTLLRSGRRTLGVTVTTGGEVRVTAPAGADRQRVEALLQRRGDWLKRQLRATAIRPKPMPPPEWRAGETHRYLGRQYRLRIRTGEPGVLLVGGYFDVTVRGREVRQVRAAMTAWYRDHAKALFARRAEELIARTPRLRLKEPPPIRVRAMRKRWGSWTPAGNLLLNVEAVKLPLGCVDYLLMHELCHLRVPDHGKRFWRLLDACMPDWERWRERLGGWEG